MENTIETTLRGAAREAVMAEVNEAARLEHVRNYHKLHVGRDGTVSWFESINRTEDIIDAQADHFAAIPSVITVGTGGYECNCDYCDMVPINHQDDGKLADCFDSKEEAIRECIGNEGTGDLAERMTAALDAIPEGYFSDEELAQ